MVEISSRYFINNPQPPGNPVARGQSEDILGTRKREMVIGRSVGRDSVGRRADVILNTRDNQRFSASDSDLDDFMITTTNQLQPESVQRIPYEILPLERKSIGEIRSDHRLRCARLPFVRLSVDELERPKIVHSCAAPGPGRAGSLNDSLSLSPSLSRLPLRAPLRHSVSPSDELLSQLQNYYVRTYAYMQTFFSPCIVAIAVTTIPLGSVCTSAAPPLLRD